MEDGEKENEEEEAVAEDEDVKGLNRRYYREQVSQGEGARKVLRGGKRNSRVCGLTLTPTRRRGDG